MSNKDCLIDRCIAIARQFGARKLILFGSALEGPEEARDIDLACEGVEGWDIFRPGARLEEELGMSVDLVRLKPRDRLGQYIAGQGMVKSSMSANQLREQLAVQPELRKGTPQAIHGTQTLQRR
jgi:predicted nucleotidyltransferase